MGIFSRMVNLFKSNTNSVLDKMEDPIKLYDLKMKELLESMHKVEGDTAEVIASVKKSDMELEKLDSEIKSIESMAKAAAPNVQLEAIAVISSAETGGTWQKRKSSSPSHV